VTDTCIDLFKFFPYSSWLTVSYITGILVMMSSWLEYGCFLCLL